MRPPVLIGSSIPAGLDQLRLHQQLKLGDIVLTSIPREKEEAMALARSCREHHIYLCFSEFLFRGTHEVCKAFGREMPREEFYSKADLDEIIDAAGEYYYGRMTLGEAGGILYWPKDYLMRLGRLCFQRLGPCATHAEAQEAYLAVCQNTLDFERRELSKGPLLNVDSSLVFKYHCMAGIDVLCLEVLPGDPHLMHAAIRGAARAYGRPWGAHIAMGWYGGVDFDPLFVKRWRTSLYLSYLAGAEFIYPESGHYGYVNAERGIDLDFHSAEMRTMRRVLREAWQFARVHTRPAGGPRVRVGLVHGQLDGSPGLWNRYAWGQFHAEKWLEGPPERGWRLAEQLHRKTDWNTATVRGAMDVSGSPPLGQYDVVPAEAPAAVLERYSCLFFPGWNTMTAELYGKLRDYVAGGGHLVMFLPQLSTHVDRAADLALFNRGDVADLFGVRLKGTAPKDVRGFTWLQESSLPGYRFPRYRVTQEDPRFLGNVTPAEVELAGAQVLAGFSTLFGTSREELLRHPALVEHTVGRGKAFLVTVCEYPADEGLLEFTRELLRVVLDGEQGEIRLLSNDRVRYAVYSAGEAGSERRYEVVYLLNTDPDNAAVATLWVDGATTGPFAVPANRLRLAYVFPGMALVPEHPGVDLHAWGGAPDRMTIGLYSSLDQHVTLHNLTGKPAPVRLNGQEVAVPAAGSARVRLERRVDPARAAFFEPGFLDEPEVQYRAAPLPY
jgi:hypothetical protein